jgi:hypothetical protein
MTFSKFFWVALGLKESVAARRTHLDGRSGENLKISFFLIVTPQLSNR